MSELSINQRAQQVLKILVERYIKDGLPIGSKTIAAEYSVGLSSATIRHILADLEESGFLASPHTSAGRIPTELGYRFFVDSLLTIKPLEGLIVQELKSKLDPDQNLSTLVNSASALLSNITQMTGVVALPKHNRLEFRQVEFLALSGKRVLVILVLNNKEVQNRVIQTDRVYSQSELQQAANYLNAHYAGRDLLVVRKELVQSMQDDRDYMVRLSQVVIDVANQAVDSKDEKVPDYVMAGQNNILNYSKESNLERLRALFAAFTQKQEILTLLDHSLDADGIQIFIGKEAGFAVLDDCSIVTAPYTVDGQIVGSLGVIGPTRMPYDRIISTVDVTAKLLSAALNQS